MLGGLWLASVAGVAQAEDAATPAEEQRYRFRRDHDPNGIGKFYLGREIAHVMGYGAAPWLEREEREEEERLTLLVEALELKPGQVVADVGAGSGVISLMMAPQVLPEGRVIAVDIQQEMLDLLGEKLTRLNVSNIDLVRGTAKSPGLEPNSVDVALLVDVYHEFEFPYEMISSLASAIRQGGRVVLVEYRREDPQVPIKLIHKMTQKQVRREIEQPEFGLKWLKTSDVLPWQHIIIFEKQAPATEPAEGAPSTTSEGAPTTDEPVPGAAGASGAAPGTQP